MKLLIETRNGFYDGWLSEILGIPLPESHNSSAAANGTQIAAESGKPGLLLQALRKELQTRNLRVSHLPDGPIVDRLLDTIQLLDQGGK